jgi:hypothetical protein
LAHTLNPFNGVLAMILMRFMSQVQVNNFIVVFAFVVSGITAFFLAREFTKSFFGFLYSCCAGTS